MDADQMDVVQLPAEPEEGVQDDEFDGPLTARISTYAIGALVMAFLSISRFVFQTVSNAVVQLGRYALHGSSLVYVFGDLVTFYAPCLITAVLAVWLSRRAAAEIAMSDGRVGGRGLARASFLCGVAVLAVSVALLMTTVIVLFARTPSAVP